MKHGKGVYKYDNGMVFNGNHKYGSLKGLGTMISSHTWYVGSWS